MSIEKLENSCNAGDPSRYKNAMIETILGENLHNLVLSLIQHSTAMPKYQGGSKSWTQVMNDTCQKYKLLFKRQPGFLNGSHFTTYVYWDGQTWVILGTSGGHVNEQASREEAAQAAVATLQKMNCQISW
jgi:hypothetical protein